MGLVARKTKGKKLGREAVLWKWTLNLWVLMLYLCRQCQKELHCRTVGVKRIDGDEEVSPLSNWSWDLGPKSLCVNIVFKKKNPYLVLLIAII